MLGDRSHPASASTREAQLHISARRTTHRGVKVSSRYVRPRYVYVLYAFHDLPGIGVRAGGHNVGTANELLPGNNVCLGLGEDLLAWRER